MQHLLEGDPDPNNYIIRENVHSRPLPALPVTTEGFRIQWKESFYQVIRILKHQPLAIVLLVKPLDSTPGKKSKRRVIKIYPRFEGFFLYEHELAAYTRLRDASCPSIPHFYGSSSTSTFLFPPDWDIDEESTNLLGPQKSIMLGYVKDAADIDSTAITPQMSENVVQALQSMHDLGIEHGEAYQGGVVRNVLILPDGSVKWIGFGYSCCSKEKGAAAKTEDALEPAKAQIDPEADRQFKLALKREKAYVREALERMVKRSEDIIKGSS